MNSHMVEDRALTVSYRGESLGDREHAHSGNRGGFRERGRGRGGSHKNFDKSTVE